MKKQNVLGTLLFPSINKLLKKFEITFVIFVVSFSVASGAANELQQLTISGKVTDLKGEPLTGVNVIIKGTTIGTTTNIEGRYALTAPDRNGILVFTFIGYDTQEVPVSGRSTVDVQLTEATTSLDEVVVTALGIKREAKTLGYATAVVDA